MSEPVAGRPRPRPPGSTPVDEPEPTPPLLPRNGDEYAPVVPVETVPGGPVVVEPVVEATPGDPPVDAPPPLAPPVLPFAAPDAGASYVSTVRAPAQIALGVVVAAVGAWILVELGLWPLAIVGVLLVAAATYYLSTVTVTVTPREITLAQGRGERDPRSIVTSEITGVSAEAFTWLQCFGIERDRHAGDTRLAVRPGPTLRLTLRTEEQVLVSVRDTAAAVNLLPESVRRT